MVKVRLLLVLFRSWEFQRIQMYMKLAKMNLRYLMIVHRSSRNCWKSPVSFCHQSSPESRKLGCCLGYCRSWKNTLGKLAVVVYTEGYSIRVLNERTILTIAAIQLAVSCSELYFAVNLCEQLFWDWVIVMSWIFCLLSLLNSRQSKTNFVFD